MGKRRAAGLTEKGKAMIDADNLDEALGLGKVPAMVEPTAGATYTHAPTMGVLDKVNYSHKDMIDFIIANPRVTQNQLAARYGYTVSWVSNVMASDAWKSAMAARRSELVDPVLTATITERFEGITRLSLERLQQKLEAPQVSDQIVLKAVELGAKALGVGGNAPPPPPPPSDHLAQLAQRLIALQSQVRQGVLPHAEVIENAHPVYAQG
jgi:hypothetical protein